MMVMMKKKSSMGRQKITIERIKKKNHLQVTFSKRRAGLFKKASELCTLCGVEIAIVIFSPAGKVFSFGHPDVDSIANQFISRNQARFGENKILEVGRGINIHELNLYLSNIHNQLEFERKRGDKLDYMKKDRKNQYWWESPIDELGIDELQQLRNAMVELQKIVTKHVNRFSVTNYAFSYSTLDDINRHVDHMTTIPNKFEHGFGGI